MVDDELRRMGIRAACFCDTSREKHGKFARGLEIITPESMIEKFGNSANVAIASETYYHEIHDHLLSVGMREENILPNKLNIFLNSNCTAKPIKMSDEQEKALKNTMLELMCAMHEICENNGINYYLIAGTLIGAVRHKGYIPWDDDVDIMMFRKDYDRFFKACMNELPDKFSVISPYDETDCFPIYRIRKKGTKRRILRSEDYISGKDVGVSIDIFPMDNVAVKNGLTQKLQEHINIILGDAIKMRCGVEVNPKHSFRCLSKVMAVFPKRILGRLNDKVLAMHNRKETEFVFFFPFTYGLRDKQTYRAEYFTRKTKLVFEGFEFWAPLEYDKVLTQFYGDYLSLPPENERFPRHPTTELVL